MRWRAGLILTAIIAAATATLASDKMVKVDVPEQLIREFAAKEGAIRWKIPLGRALPEEMTLVAPGKLLVGLRKDVVGLPNLDYLLVDTATGASLWRYSREKKKGAFQLVLVRSDRLVFLVEEAKRFVLTGLATADGAEKWSKPFEGDTVRFFAAPNGAGILVEQGKGRETTLTVLNAADGGKRWSRKFPIAGKGEARPQPMWVQDDVCLFANGVERLAGTDGHTVWARSELLFDENCPQPRLDGEELLVIHNANRLTDVEAGSGRSLWSLELPAQSSYTNIYPTDQRLYVRSLRKLFPGAAAGTGVPILIAVRRQDPQILWSYTSDAPVVSNLVEAEDRLFFATAAKLVALRLSNGAPLFAAEVTNSGRTFPVRVRAYPDKIVFIGELIVAAYDPESGSQIYNHGMTPVSIETSLTSLDSAIPRLKEEVAALQRGKATSSLAKSFGDEASRYQEMSNAYRHEAWTKQSVGDKMGADLASIKARTASGSAAGMSSAAFFMAVWDLSTSLRNALELSQIAGLPERQELFRKSILSSYLAAENADYVYRPNRRMGTGEEDFTSVTVIQLATGRRRDTVLSPTYLSYGLWNVVDFENGLVFHHGIGLDPAAYRWSDNELLPAQGKVRTIENFLIAAPVRIPR